MMLRISVMVATMWLTFRDRLDDAYTARRDERGITTLELVVLGLGLFLLAGAVVLVIKTAVDNRTAQIK